LRPAIEAGEFLPRRHSTDCAGKLEPRLPVAWILQASRVGRIERPQNRIGLAAAGHIMADLLQKVKLG
jgi:hypothetical protein